MMLALLLTAQPQVTSQPLPGESRGPVQRVGTGPRLSPGRNVGRSQGAAQEAQTPVEAERAFAADAQALGQWTAFRKWAAADAVMFLPQPANAQAALKDWRDPPRSIEWWPTASYTSCDGKTAVNTGGWRQPDGSVGFFSTVWQRQSDGSWRWLVDGGDTLREARPRPRRPLVVRASCAKLSNPYMPPTGPQAGSGRSSDGSLTWEWSFNATSRTRVFSSSYWDGRRYVEPFEDLIAVPAASATP